MVNRPVTGAHYGIISWLQQRVTAVIMLVITILFVASIAFIASQVDSSIVSWQKLFHHTIVKVVMQLFFLALLLHAWVGVRDIWMDYIKCNIIKLGLYVLTIVWLLLSLMYSVKVLWI